MGTGIGTSLLPSWVIRRLRSWNSDSKNDRAYYLLTNQYWGHGGREYPRMDPRTVAMFFSARERYF